MANPLRRPVRALRPGGNSEPPSLVPVAEFPDPGGARLPWRRSRLSPAIGRALRIRSAPDEDERLLEAACADRLLSRHEAEACRRQSLRLGVPVEDILSAEGLIPAADLRRLRAGMLGLDALPASALEALTPCPVPGLSPAQQLALGICPYRDADGRLCVAVSDLTVFRGKDAPVPLDLLLAPKVLASRAAIQARLARHYQSTLVADASARVPAAESSRVWSGRLRRRQIQVALGLLAVAALLLAWPLEVLTILTLMAWSTLVISIGLKLAAFVSALTLPAARPGPGRREEPPPMPRISILVPLYKEREMLPLLVRRLMQLTYPKALLEVILVLEEHDAVTHAALSDLSLPPWIRALNVPAGSPQTKPRAMNYALDFCRGEVIGIFDAEDAPHPDQLTRVAQRFAERPPEVVCLQGVLDFYNSTQNWIARCFTIEYASWFRVILPGMARLGLAIPLGGTSLYFRRHALEELGGWDAHNVTEDADLGFRLARHGYRAEMIDTVTEEEANCRPWAWVKQRSRWLKGYMTTYLVHMRAPGRLWRQLGPRKFIGFQLHFITALSQFMLAPLLWSFWLMVMGFPHPVADRLPQALVIAIGVSFLFLELLHLTIYMRAVATPERRHLIKWAPSMHVYLPFGAIAFYKALYELVFSPFFWDKTHHGLSINPPRRGVWRRLRSRGTRASDG